MIDWLTNSIFRGAGSTAKGDRNQREGEQPGYQQASGESIEVLETNTSVGESIPTLFI